MRLWTWHTDPSFVRLNNPRCMEVARLLGSVSLSIEWADEVCVGNAMQVVQQLRMEGLKDVQLCLHASPGHHDVDLAEKTRQVIEWVQAYNGNGYADPIGAVFLDCEIDKIGDDASHNAACVARKNQWYADVKSSLAPFDAPVTWYSRGVTTSDFGNKWVVTGNFTFSEATEPRVFSFSHYEPWSFDRGKELVDANMRFASMMTANDYTLQLWISLGSAYIDTVDSKVWENQHDAGPAGDIAIGRFGRQLREKWYWGKLNYVDGSRVTDVIFYPGPDTGDVWLRQLKAFMG